VGGIRLRSGLRRDKLGLIGFVSWGGAERNIVVNACSTGGCVGFVVEGIGFVLHNTGPGRVANWAGWAVWEMTGLKSEILIPKSETMSKSK